MVSKSGLAIILSKLKVFDSPEISLEQYPTDSEIAADFLNFAMLRGEIQDKVVLDLGSGTGVLGIGALLSGAKKVYFVDKDENALILLKRNMDDFEFENYEILHKGIHDLEASDFSEEIDLVIQNPPFGTQEKHADKAFLEVAFSFAPLVYSFHKTSTKLFVNVMAKDNGFEVTNRFDYNFPLKNAYEFHRRKIHRVEVSCFRIEKRK